MLEAGASPRDLAQAWKPSESEWLVRRKPFLLY